MSHYSGQQLNTDTGQLTHRDYSVGVPEAPMTIYNGGIYRKVNRQAPDSDVDGLPHQTRSYVNASGAQDVQINNGLHHRIGTGYRWGYAGAGYLYAVVPRIPGQTRGDVAGFHRRGPSPLNWNKMWQAGPGSQPDNPGGPGRIAGPQLVNPMTG